MAKTYERQNAKVIEDAFIRLVSTKEHSLKSGMYALMRDAVKIALGLHDEGHQRHLTVGDSYGWMLVIDGVVDKVEIVSNGSMVGETRAMLDSYVKKMPRTGIAGIVMAGMKPARFFAIRYEKSILENTIQITRQNFYQYFKKI